MKCRNVSNYWWDPTKIGTQKFAPHFYFCQLEYITVSNPKPQMQHKYSTPDFWWATEIHYYVSFFKEQAQIYRIIFQLHLHPKYTGLLVNSELVALLRFSSFKFGRPTF